MKRIGYAALLLVFTATLLFAAGRTKWQPQEETVVYAAEETFSAGETADVKDLSRAEAEPAVMRLRAETATLYTDVLVPEAENPYAVSLSGAITDLSAEAEINFDAPFPFFIKINRIANTVTVYGIDKNGAYSIPYKAFVCSAGEHTPLGIYQTSTKARWLALVGGVWGQYTTRITGPYWFHSVPYFTQNESDLEYEEFNKLGSLASLGCIRMTVEDVKWIYDNCPEGTFVELFDDIKETGPLGKPVPPVIRTDSEKRGWDPTDPNPDNPWKNPYSATTIRHESTGRASQ